MNHEYRTDVIGWLVIIRRSEIIERHHQTIVEAHFNGVISRFDRPVRTIVVDMVQRWSPCADISVSRVKFVRLVGWSVDYLLIAVPVLQTIWSFTK